LPFFQHPEIQKQAEQKDFVIKNRQQLIEAGSDNADKQARAILLDIIEATIAEADPALMISRMLGKAGNKWAIDNQTLIPSDFERVFVLGAGKAGKRMTAGLNLALDSMINGGLVNIPAEKTEFCGKVELHPASHPLPNESGIDGAKRILKMATQAKENDLVICLLSGGGSSLLPMPATGITLEDKQLITSLLLRSGAAINEINSVRKHISAIKGGQLARAAYPATLISLILSDVIGDPLDVIASGPTVADESTYGKAKRILCKYGLWEKAPASVKQLIEKGVAGKMDETPKAGDICLSRSRNIIIGNNLQLRRAAAAKAASLGLRVCSIEKPFVCDSEKAACELIDLVFKCRNEISPIRMLVIAGGETTVKVTGPGIGGRAQHLALSFMIKAQQQKNGRFVFAAIGSDGVDGPTEAAGALIDYQSFSDAQGQGLNPVLSFEAQDSHRFFRETGSLIKTGYTGTNLNDLYLALIY
jgi:glycerate-2-kinase